jgi:ABC-2 type transport system permease protein
MTALVRAELLKFRTTRSSLIVLLAAAALTGIAVSATVGTAEDRDLGTSSLSRNVFASALVTALIVFLVGITTVTTEWRHGTVTRTFLGTPRRGRVLLAKELWVVVLGASVFVAALLLTLAIAVPWLALDGSSFVLDGHALSIAGRGVLAAMLWGALGVGVGSVVQNQTAALIGAVLWVLPVEALLGALLNALDHDEVRDFLPARALAAVDGTTEGALSLGPGTGVSLCYVVGFAVLGWLRMRRQDIT